MFEIILVGRDYHFVVLKTPLGKINDKTRFYLNANWAIPGYELKKFHRITSVSAHSYFLGKSAELGFEDTPNEIFESIEDVDDFVETKRNAISSSSHTIEEVVY